MKIVKDVCRIETYFKFILKICFCEVIKYTNGRKSQECKEFVYENTE